MRKRDVIDQYDVLATPGVELPTFGTGDVAWILKAEFWRIQKYVDSPKYPISPSGRLGSGRGSRRVFTDTDVFRFGIADRLVRDGHSYKFVSKALQQLKDEDLLGPFDSEGQELDRVYVLIGGEENLQVKPIERDNTIEDLAKRFKSPSLYLLDINKIVFELQKRMMEIQKRKKG